jgi:hypothetical protein
MAELKNLNELKTQTETKFHSSFSYDDRRLPAKFKELITKFDNDKITYNEYSFEVQRSSEGIIVAPNQWLYIAAYYSSYCREMFAYKQELVNHLLTQYNTKKALEEPIKKCQNNIEGAKSLLANYPEGNNKNFLIKFLSNYSWWGGAKTIDRSDFCASAILSSANLVNATQGYVADICEFLAENPEAENILLTASENPESLLYVDSKKYLESCQDNQKYLTAIRTKPFLLLAGISGTGKSRIVRELAFMTCPKELQDEDGTTPGNYCMIEVKPNWHDSTELLGYYSSFNGGGYRFTKFDRFVVKAWLNPDVPFFVCLDEMNLAPVEQYFAEFLSVLETRSRDKEGHVVTGALVDKQYFKDDTKMTTELGLDKGDDWTIKVRSDLVNKGLTLPPNLIVIGTVNMDDTTYQFSRKVIDRAMTIEMNGGELSQMFGNSNSLKYRSDEDVVKLGMLKAPYINADEVIERYQSQAQIIKEKLPEKLEAVNTALKDTPFQVSYRVLNELVIYLGALMDEATAKGESIDDDALSALIDQAMDQITLMKILPRIEGDEDMFRRSGGANVLKTLQSLFSEDSDSYRKLEEMTDRLNRTGFTRFWP